MIFMNLIGKDTLATHLVKIFYKVDKCVTAEIEVVQAHIDGFCRIVSIRLLYILQE